MFIMGLDLGQAQDPTALAIVEAHGTEQSVELPVERYSQMLGAWGWTTERQAFEGLPAYYDVRHLERLPLGTSYPAVAEGVRRLLGAVGQPCVLAVDGSGLGRPVVDLLWQLGLSPLSVVITGGNEAGELEDGTLTVPKADLVAVIAVGLQTGRLRIAPGLDMAEALAQELQTFEVRVTASAHAVYGARTGAHDDLVLALAIACWAANYWYGRTQTWEMLRDPGVRAY